MTDNTGSHCDLSPPSYEGVEIVDIHPDPSPADYLAAMAIANDIADEEGSLKAANMVMLGALLKLKPDLVSYESAVAALEEAVSSRNKALNEINLKALKRGWDLF